MTKTIAPLAAVLLAASAATPVFAQATQPASTQPAATQPAANDTGTSPSDALKLAIAERHGLADWPAVTRLAFTFNVETANRRVERVWTWAPHTNAVTLFENSTTTAFTHGPDVPEADRAADAKFINDTYWLLMPFYLVWADCELSPPTILDGDDKPDVLSDIDGPITMTTVTFPTGGYTPGDAYDLYLDETNLLIGWTFRRGGKPGGNVMPFFDHVTQHGITMALDHQRPGGGFRLWFTEVEVEAPPSAN
ncbi:MAG: hypothetical protein AAGK09_00730 [Planctomycetota bacterium]